MNYDLQKLSVRIRNEQSITIGSGLLYITKDANYSYVITAAHVFDEVTYPILLECFSNEKETKDEYNFYVDSNDVIVHPNYNLSINPEDNEEFDTAIIRLPHKIWMKSCKKSYFGKAINEQKIEGFGYLSNSMEEDIALDAVEFTSDESIITNTSNNSNRLKAFLKGPHDLDNSNRISERAGLSGMALVAANQDEIILVGMAINIPEPNGLLGKITLIDSRVAKELLEQEGINCEEENISKITHNKIEGVTQNIIQSTRQFVHRETELENIKNNLYRNNNVVLCGIGGIGKTELAKHYANIYGNSYVQSYLIHCSNSIASGIVNFIRIEGIDRRRIEDGMENDVQFSQRILEFIRYQPNYSWLLIFDDVSPRDPLLNQVTELVHHKIFTTRWDDFEWKIHATKITALSNLNSRKDLFEKYLNRCLSSNEIDTFNAISNIVDGHTLTLQLIALQCRESDMTLEEIYNTLRTNGLHIDSKETFIYSKSSSERNMYGHIRGIWNLSNFSKSEIRIMQALSLIASNRITKKEFKQWLALDSMNDLNQLIHRGWIQIDEDSGMIYLHSVIGEVVYNELYLNNPEDLSTMIAILIERVNDRSLEVKEQLRYISYGTIVGKRLTISVDTIHLLNLVGLHLEYFRQLEEAFKILNLANEYVDKMDINQSIWAGHTLNNLGVIYQTKIDNENAILHFNKAISIYKKCGEEGKGSWGYALHNIAKSNYYKGNIQEALILEAEAEPLIKEYRIFSLGEIFDVRRECYCKLVEQNYNRYQQLLSSKYPIRILLEKLKEKIEFYINQTLACGKLAIKYKKPFKKQDEYGFYDSISYHAVNKAMLKQDKKAIQDIELVLTFFETTTGNQSVHTGNVYNNMCIIYDQLNEPHKAYQCGEKAVEILAKTLGDKHRSVINAKDNLEIARKKLIG